MATSGTYTDISTNLTIISEALKKINRLGDFETLSDTDVRYTSALASLKMVCKHLATMGMPLWAIEEASIPFSNFTTISGVTIGLAGATITQVPPLKILQALRRDDTNDLDYEMELNTQDQYNELVEKDATGAPLFYTYYPKGPAASSNAAQGQLKVWPLPDSYWTTNGSILIRYQRPFQDVGTSTQQLDFPQEWQLAVVYKLATVLAPNYGIDMNQRQLLNKDAKEIIDEAEGFATEEGSIFFQPIRRR